MVRIMVVDDHDLVRESLSALLAADPELDVVGDCADGAAAIELADRLRPDVIVMDLQMPGVNGAVATQEIVRRFPGVRVLILTGVPGSRLAAEAMAAGARACIAKTSDLAPVVAAIRA